jgi:hypothetical protein
VCCPSSRRRWTSTPAGVAPMHADPPSCSGSDVGGGRRAAGEGGRAGVRCGAGAGRAADALHPRPVDGVGGRDGRLGAAGAQHATRCTEPSTTAKRTDGRCGESSASDGPGPTHTLHRGEGCGHRGWSASHGASTVGAPAVPRGRPWSNASDHDRGVSRRQGLGRTSGARHRPGVPGAPTPGGDPGACARDPRCACGPTCAGCSAGCCGPAAQRPREDLGAPTTSRSERCRRRRPARRSGPVARIADVPRGTRTTPAPRGERRAYPPRGGDSDGAWATRPRQVTPRRER